MPMSTRRGGQTANIKQSSIWYSLALLLCLPLASASTAAPFTLSLEGGLFHSSGYFTRALLGGQSLRLQIDISQGALTVNYAKCTNCRVGDHRYDPLASTTGGTIACADPRCGRHTCKGLRGFKCGSCSAAGACCAADFLKLAKDGSGGGITTPPTCAFHQSFGKGSTANGSLSSDTLELSTKDSRGARLPEILFGAVMEESQSFEMPYVDGVLGMVSSDAKPSLIRSSHWGACRKHCF
jgi:hypothetical protein